jgi:hypothetical protein
LKEALQPLFYKFALHSRKRFVVRGMGRSSSAHFVEGVDFALKKKTLASVGVKTQISFFAFPRFAFSLTLLTKRLFNQKERRKTPPLIPLN